jgi:hypothetical protein
MNSIYNVKQLKEFLSTQPIGVDAVDTIIEFAQLQANQLAWSRKRCDVAARLLGHDMITEMLDDDC